MTTLYRKYRPQVFDEVYGQDHIVETLKRALDTNRVAHAYLFCGGRGVGKTTVARIMAKAVNCTNESPPAGGRPCGKCANCKSITAGKFIDLIEIDAASNRGIDEIRDLRDKIQFAPSIGKKRVYIIDEVHMLTREAFNALLKTLEEPPAHTIFIFATTEAHKVPVTVMSRCQRFDFLLADEEQVKNNIKKIIKSEGFKVDDKVVDLIVRASGGSFRDSQSLLDQLSPYLASGEISIEQALQILNLTSFEKVSEFASLLRSGSVAEGFEFIRELMSHGVDFSDFMKMVIIEIRGQLIEKIMKNEETGWETATLQRLIKAQEDLKVSPIESLAIELAIADIAVGEASRSQISDVKSQNDNAKLKNKEKDNQDIQNARSKELEPNSEVRIAPPASAEPACNVVATSGRLKALRAGRSEPVKTEENKDEKKEVGSRDKAEVKTEVKKSEALKIQKQKLEFSDDQRRAIVEEVSLKNKTLGSLLSTASWVADGDGVTIFVEYSFYKDKILDKKNFPMLVSVAQNIFNDTVQIRCEVKKHSDNITEEIDEVFG